MAANLSDKRTIQLLVQYDAASDILNNENQTPQDIVLIQKKLALLCCMLKNQEKDELIEALLQQVTAPNDLIETFINQRLNKQSKDVRFNLVHQESSINKKNQFANTVSFSGAMVEGDEDFKINHTNFFPQCIDFSADQDEDIPKNIREESLRLAKEQGRIGPHEIHGFNLLNVKNDGNCFYRAVVNQMQLIGHHFLNNVPLGTFPHDSLRLRIEGQNFKDGEWADIPEIFKLVKKSNLIVAIIDTRYPDLGFRCYYPDASNETQETYDSNSLPLNLPIIRLAFIGNHYLSVGSHPYLDSGAIRAAFNDPKSLLFSSFQRRSPFSTVFHEKNIIRNRHDNEEMQHEYDKRFGLIPRPN